MTRILYLLSFAFCLLQFGETAKAQENKTSYSIKEATDYAIKHSHERKNSQRDILIAKQKINESIAIGLPQITGKFSNNNFLDIPTTLIPDFIGPVVFQVNEDYFNLQPNKDLPAAGFIPAQFGTKYNASAEVGVNQLIFSGSYIVGLMASKAYLNQAVLADSKVEYEVESQIAKSYYAVLLTQNNLEIFQTQLKNTEQLAYETEETFKSGLIEDTDADQLKLLVADLKASVSNAELQIDIAKNNLKLVMGMPIQENIILSDHLDVILETESLQGILDQGFQVDNNVNFKLAENQVNLMELNYRNNKTSYLPNISAFFNAKADAMRNDFDFFDTEKRWYPTTVFGFQLNWDLWTSGKRNAIIKQSKIEMYKAEEDKFRAENQLNAQYINLKSTALNYFKMYKNKAESKELAKKIYNKTQLKYKEGVSSSNDLLNTYNQYLRTESDYFISIMNYLSANSELKMILKKF